MMILGEPDTLETVDSLEEEIVELLSRTSPGILLIYAPADKEDERSEVENHKKS